ncbi:MAG: TIGR02221 family CRISPR-associated protein [Campylobacterota bacterium]|nr:TIGR02221 family CRISPR-associated protein [Campylobacterota bacterium]
MANLFISFLGTGDYKPCSYRYGNQKIKIENVDFVQETIVSLFCSDWQEKDRILIFYTKKSKEKNWEKLNIKLKSLNMKPSIEGILISDGKSEEEIWEIFSTIFDKINNNDNIICDITHSFRSIPLLGIAVINYAQVLKDASLKGVYYGAFDASETSTKPIFDLTPYSSIMNWSFATSEFIKRGETGALVELMKIDAKTKDIESNKTAQRLNKISKKLDKMSLAIKLNRGKQIVEKISNLNDEISFIQKDKSFSYLNALLDKIKQKTKDFKINNVENCIVAAQWCYEHDLIPQCITILQEGIITYICGILSLDYHIEKDRELISQSLAVINKIPEEKWNPPLKENPEIAEKVNNVLNENIIKEYRSLGALRNDVNHCGFLKNATRAEIIQNKAGEFLDIVKNFFNQMEEKK